MADRRPTPRADPRREPPARPSGPPLVDLFASQPHYAEHLVPIFEALPEHLRGDCWASSSSRWWGPRRPRHARPDRVTLVAGWHDARHLAPERVVFVEHGAGQTYVGLEHHPSYAGGNHAGANVLGYVAPSAAVASRWTGAPSVAVGSPRLDQWLPEPPTAEPRTLAVTWHWWCNLLPETRPAWRHYERAMPALVKHWRREGWTVLAHAHPRAQSSLEGFWRDAGCSITRDNREVLERSALLLADNTSLMYEAAALGRRVLALNCPTYRRDVEHGMRFWSLVPGHQVDGPTELAALDLASYVDDDPSRAERERAVAHVYAYLDGRSAHRAAQFVAELIGAPWARDDSPGTPAE